MTPFPEFRHAFTTSDGDPTLLSAEEQKRAAGLTEGRQAQFIRSHALLRQLAAEALACHPAEVPLASSSDGRPILPGTGFHVSLSHSADGALAVIARTPVGGDLEACPGRSRDTLAISRRFFHGREAERLQAAAPEKRHGLFLEQWTRKEALFKTGLQDWQTCLTTDLWDGVLGLPEMPVHIIRPALPEGWIGRIAVSCVARPLTRPHRFTPFHAASALFLASLLCRFWPGMAAGLLATGLGVASRRSFFGPIHRHLADPSRLALTFDDGPDPALTPDVLDMLDRYGFRATFFLVARRAERHPELVRQILSRGHQIGCHDLDHSNLSNFRLTAGFRRDLGEAQALLTGIAGRAPSLYRPPVGLTNPHLFPVLRELGMHCVLWSRSAWDAGNRNSAHIRRLETLPEGGAIILLHDALPRPELKTEVLEHLGLLFGEIRRRKLLPGRLDELLGIPTWRA